MALTPWALTTVANSKTHLGIAANDASQNSRLEMFINAASQRIETMTSRCLKERTHTQYGSGDRSNTFILDHYPITSITELCIDNSSVFGASTIIDPTKYSVTKDGYGILLLSDVFYRGNRNIKATYVAGYNDTDHPGNLAELEIGCLWIVEWYYRHRERADMGRTQKSKGDESVGILAEMPAMIKEIIHEYKRIEMPLSDRVERR